MGDFFTMKEIYEQLPPTLTVKKFMALPKNYSLYLSCIDPHTRRTRAIADLSQTELNNFGFKKISNNQYLKFWE